MPNRSQRHLRETRGYDSAGQLLGRSLSVVPQSVALNFPPGGEAGTAAVSARLRLPNGVNIVGQQVSVIANDLAVCTATTPPPTNNTGTALFTITAVAEGETTVDVSFGEETIAIAVVVSEGVMTLDPVSMTLDILNDVPETEDVTVTLALSNGTPIGGATLTATSNGENFCTVSTPDATDSSGETSFTVTAVAAGTTTITVDYDGETADVDVTVTETTDP